MPIEIEVKINREEMKRWQKTEEETIANNGSSADDNSSMNPSSIANNSRDGQIQNLTSDESERVK